MATNSTETAYSVAAISELLKSRVESWPEVWIEGELSEVNNRPGAGIMYMRLKDSIEDVSVSIHCYRNLFQTFVGLEENSKVKVKVHINLTETFAFQIFPAFHHPVIWEWNG